MDFSGSAAERWRSDDDLTGVEPSELVLVLSEDVEDVEGEAD